MAKPLMSTVATVALLASAAQAEEELLELTRDCDTALALSSAPSHVQAKAGVYVLGEAGYELVRESENGYHCIAVREAPNEATPQCFDRAGFRSHVTPFLDAGRQLRQGKSFEEIHALRDEKFKTGEYLPADGYGVVYMISDFTLVRSENEPKKRRVRPHVMYHAPYMGWDDIGLTPVESLKNLGLPFLPPGAGGPQAFQASFVESSSDPSEVLAKCKGQLPDREDYILFPPRG